MATMGADANDYYGCPHGGDHFARDECRLLSTNDNHGNLCNGSRLFSTDDNHGNLCNGSRLFSTDDNHGWRLRAVANNFVSQLTVPQVVRSFNYEFWRFFFDKFVSAGDPGTPNQML